VFPGSAPDMSQFNQQVPSAVGGEAHSQCSAARCYIEEGIRKPRWNIDCVRRDLLRSHRNKEGESDDEVDQPMAHVHLGTVDQALLCPPGVTILTSGESTRGLVAASASIRDS